MRTYEHYSQSPDGWNITATLKLEDEGQFRYHEGWADYTNATIGVTAEGSWRRDGAAIVLHPLSVEGSVGGWVVGQERRVTERGDTLDFGDGFTLRLPPEREEVVPVHNAGTKALTVVLEPWSTRHEVAPGGQVYVVARGPIGAGKLEVVRGGDEVVVYGWSESRVAIVTVQDHLGAVAGFRARGAKVAPPIVAAPGFTSEAGPEPRAQSGGEPKPPATTPEHAAPKTSQAAGTPGSHTRAGPVPRAEVAGVKLTLPPALADLIRQWINELPAEGTQNWVMRTCKELNALPLHSNLIYIWALRADGVVLCMDHEAFGHPTEPETDLLTVYAALAEGARRHPELGALIPPRPAGARECELCSGAGRAETSGAEGSTACGRCRGLGWYVRVTCGRCGGAGRTAPPGAGASTACPRCSGRGWHVALTLH